MFLVKNFTLYKACFFWYLCIRFHLLVIKIKFVWFCYWLFSSILDKHLSAHNSCHKSSHVFITTQNKNILFYSFFTNIASISAVQYIRLFSYMRLSSYAFSYSSAYMTTCMSECNAYSFWWFVIESALDPTDNRLLTMLSTKDLRMKLQTVSRTWWKRAKKKWKKEEQEEEEEEWKRW
jgi:hypothetical protein